MTLCKGSLLKAFVRYSQENELTIIENQSSVTDNNRSKPDLILFSYLILSISCFSTTSDGKIRLPTNVRSLNNKYDQTLIRNLWITNVYYPKVLAQVRCAETFISIEHKSGEFWEFKFSYAYAQPMINTLTDPRNVHLIN